MKPVIGKPMGPEELFNIFSDPELMAETAYALHDWIEATTYLDKKGAPKIVDGVVVPMVERIKHLIGERDGPTIEIIGSR